jgi:deazaflavin-dependent oxidoreductase (nitroreductase family)
MAAERDWNAEVIAEFRANGGEVAAPYDDPPPMVLLHTIGARSGREHVVPMRAMPDGDAFYVFATAHGSDRNPDWFHNVVAHPEFTIELGAATTPVRSTVLAGAERAEILRRWRERVPLVTGVLDRTPREVPVVRLDPRDARAQGRSQRVNGTAG